MSHDAPGFAALLVGRSHPLVSSVFSREWQLVLYLRRVSRDVVQLVDSRSDNTTLHQPSRTVFRHHDKQSERQMLGYDEIDEAQSAAHRQQVRRNY